MRNNIMFFIALFAISIFTLAGCGGGGGSAPAGTTVNRGVVTAEGNIVVNGVFYNISSANIVIDGLAATKNDLKVGMVVTVKGIFDNRTSHAIRRTASRVELVSNFQGPVDCVNPLDNSLTIMGQQVLVKTTPPNQTVFANFSSLRTIFANISTVSKLNREGHLSPDFDRPDHAAPCLDQGNSDRRGRPRQGLRYRQPDGGLLRDDSGIPAEFPCPWPLCQCAGA